MSLRKKKSDYSYILNHISKYKDSFTPNEKSEMDALHEKYDSKDMSIPPLSQSEREHLTYLMVLDEYNNSKQKRTAYRKYGALVIIITGIIFLALMFSLDTKIEFLVLWVISILYCVAVMIRAEYRYHMFKEFLGIADEFDYYEMIAEENDEEEDVVMVSPPEVPEKKDAGVKPDVKPDVKTEPEQTPAENSSQASPAEPEGKK